MLTMLSSLVHTSCVKSPVEPSALEHRNLLTGPFWERIPAYQGIPEQTFNNPEWQAKHSITSFRHLQAILHGLVSPEFLNDVSEGLAISPMQIRLTPNVLALIDWSNPYSDPLRIQFIPLASTKLPDHPKVELDSLHEQEDMPVPGLTHRYPDKLLVLPTLSCVVACRFCTRSYVVHDRTTDEGRTKRWSHDFAPKAIEYIKSRPEVEDVLISGGDACMLAPEFMLSFGEQLLDIPHVRRIRFATRSLSVLPQKILFDEAWRLAIADIAALGRQNGKEVALHTHFNHPHEITYLVRLASDLLFQSGILVRNQSVLLRGVNDSAEVMTLLIKRLSYINIHPYYVYLHDMVRGCEELRTTLQTGLDIEKAVRGATSGFNTPTFVVDLPGGGGKRDAHSYESYDREKGISVFTAPSVKAGQFLYYDPLPLLPESGQNFWQRKP